MEPGFVLLSYISGLFSTNSVRIVFVVFALFSVFLKITAIRVLALDIYYSIYLYIVLYFVLHEMTQIRAGLASGIFLYAIPSLEKNKSRYVFLILIASLFHYSALVLLVLIFVNHNSINRPLYFLLPILAIITSIFSSTYILLLEPIIVFAPRIISNRFFVHGFIETKLSIRYKLIQQLYYIRHYRILYINNQL